MTDKEIQQLARQLDGFEALIETHISWVILGQKYAWKIKKPMKYTFLDFSEVEKREEICWKEVQLNRRLAPDVYLDVAKVCQLDNELVLLDSNCSCQNILDYAVKMRRLDASLEMDKQLAAGNIKTSDIEVLANIVAKFHQKAKVISTAKQGDAKIYKNDFNDILGQTEVFNAVSPDAIQDLETTVAISDAFLASHSKLIQTRLAAGFVRDVHGDLHARNVFAYPTPIIFDCIEFNDHFRQIDVLNEIAFFCMDLEANGFDALSESFLSTYLQAFPAMQEKGSADLFIWFKCYRANIRAKVNALRSAQAKGQQKAKANQQMLHYLKLMLRYAKSLPSTF